MTTLAACPPRSDDGLLPGYLRYVRTSGLSGRAIRDRVRIATGF